MDDVEVVFFFKKYWKHKSLPNLPSHWHFQVKVIGLRGPEVSFSSFSNKTKFLLSGVFCIPNAIPSQSPRNCFVPHGVTIGS
jgi:hypothetical protein